MFTNELKFKEEFLSKLFHKVVFYPTDNNIKIIGTGFNKILEGFNLDDPIFLGANLTSDYYRSEINAPEKLSKLFFNISTTLNNISLLNEEGFEKYLNLHKSLTTVKQEILNKVPLLVICANTEVLKTEAIVEYLRGLRPDYTKLDQSKLSSLLSDSKKIVSYFSNIDNLHNVVNRY